MHDMHKLSVDVTFTHMAAKKGINNHGERAGVDMYKEYIHLEYVKVMEALYPDSLIISQVKVSFRAINIIQ